MAPIQFPYIVPANLLPPPRQRHPRAVIIIRPTPLAKQPDATADKKVDVVESASVEEDPPKEEAAPEEPSPPADPQPEIQAPAEKPVVVVDVDEAPAAQDEPTVPGETPLAEPSQEEQPAVVDDAAEAVPAVADQSKDDETLPEPDKAEPPVAESESQPAPAE